MTSARLGEQGGMVPRADAAKWLLLTHQIPAKPDYLRVKIRRRLAQLGAVALKNSVYLLPADAEGRKGLGGLAREILGQGGEAVLCEAELVEGLADGAIEDLLRAAHEAQYATVGKEAKRLALELRGAKGREEPRRRRV